VHSIRPLENQLWIAVQCSAVQCSARQYKYSIEIVKVNIFHIKLNLETADD